MASKTKRTRRKVLRKNKGFTLVEIIVVLGILAILMSITLLAVNPAEQASHAKDITTKATAEDFIKANTIYYTEKKALPWTHNAACLNELALGGTLDTMPNCVEELTKAGTLKNHYLQQSEIHELHMNKCHDSAVICYRPRSKEEYTHATYDKFGVNKPGCPGHNPDATECYWCKPVMGNPTCTAPTPTIVPLATPTLTSVPTATLAPLPTPTPTVTLTPTPIPSATPTLTPAPTSTYQIGGYALDDTKLFQTYAVFFFDQPSFVSSWYEVSVSTNSAFPNDYTQTDRYFAPVSTPQFGTLTSSSHKAYINFSNKLVGFQSLPHNWPFYKCGRTLYWKVFDFPAHTHETEVYSNTIDCTTKVGAFSTTGTAPLNWYIYYPFINADGSVKPGQPYNSIIDANGDGKVDWVDYIILSMNTKMRAGGWGLPE